MHHWATPPNIVKAEKAVAATAAAGQDAKEQGQQKLGFMPIIGPREFTRATTLDAITKLIATNNQVSLQVSSLC